MAGNFPGGVPDIPPIGSAPSISADPNALRDQLRRQYAYLARTNLSDIANNTAAYMNRRASVTRTSTVVFKRIFKDATFIPAHPTRFAVGGNDYEHTQSFMLHRPGFDAASSRMDNLIREFVQPGRQASSHFGVSLAGQIVQFVDLADIAYHTGSNVYRNHQSIGVEMEGAVGTPLTDAMYSAVASLIARVSLLSGMPIDRAHIVQHYEVLPGVKYDAGRNVNVDRLLSEAQNPTTRYDRNDLFRAPFSPDSTRETIVASIMALASPVATSAASQSVVQRIASEIAAQTRAASISSTTRSGLAELSAVAGQSAMTSYAEQYAFIQNVIGQAATVTPQTNVVGVLLNMDDGVYNDGRAP